MLTPEFLTTLRTRYGLPEIEHISRLEGGEWKTLFRLDSPPTALVVSISHPATVLAGVAYEHAFLRHLHAQLPQIPAPIVAQDGSSYFLNEDRIVTLFPWMPGAISDRDTMRLPAARFLAQYHQAALAYLDHATRPGIPAWWSLDWVANYAWHWPTIQQLLDAEPTEATGAARRFWQAGGTWAAELQARRAQIAEARAYFQKWLTQLAHADRALHVAPIHDDYHRKNLLSDGTQITALLDWDGCHPDWLVLDVSVAMWEFCKEPAKTQINRTQAQAFLAAYQAAGGPVTARDFDLLIPLIRCRRIIEVLSSLQGIVNGDPWDEDFAEYAVGNLLALENLRNETLL